MGVSSVEMQKRLALELSADPTKPEEVALLRDVLDLVQSRSASVVTNNIPKLPVAGPPYVLPDNLQRTANAAKALLVNRKTLGYDAEIATETLNALELAKWDLPTAEAALGVRHDCISSRLDRYALFGFVVKHGVGRWGPGSRWEKQEWKKHALGNASDSTSLSP
jgi:hypothetical protein